MQSKLPASACTIPALQPELQSVSSTRPLSVCHSFLMCLRPAVTNALTKFQFMKQRYQHRSTGCADHKRCRQCSPKAVIHFLSISKPYSYSCLFFINYQTNLMQEQINIAAYADNSIRSNSSTLELKQIAKLNTLKMLYLYSFR